MKATDLKNNPKSLWLFHASVDRRSWSKVLQSAGSLYAYSRILVFGRRGKGHNHGRITPIGNARESIRYDRSDRAFIIFGQQTNQFRNGRAGLCPHLGKKPA